MTSRKKFGAAFWGMVVRLCAGVPDRLWAVSVARRAGRDSRNGSQMRLLAAALPARSLAKTRGEPSSVGTDPSEFRAANLSS